MRTRATSGWWVIGLVLGACTSSSFDLSGPLGDECKGICQRPPDAGPDMAILDQGPPPPDRGVDRGVVDVGVDPDAGQDAAVDQGVDAAPTCELGSIQACGTNQGLCSEGTQVCGSDGVFGPCEGTIDPGVEACDGLDNDCDGNTDEDVTLPCGTDEGACVAGLRRCMDGVLGACEGGQGPSPEQCNAEDDDCDGVLDEDVLQGCDPAPDVCAFGTQTCMEGAFGACVQPAGPIDELCDGVDNDCDGLADEGLVRPCGSAVGACVPGQELCLGGTWSLCDGAIGPTDEQCNAVDDDCDGTVDEALIRACGVANAPCELGAETCDQGAWGECLGGVQPVAETCDGQDNDCDGGADEGLEAEPCGGVEGICMPGVRTCTDGVPGACVGGIEPQEEDCNTLDDDCDGAVDEVRERACGSDVGICQPGVERCLPGGWGPCLGGAQPLFELCNGLDDDCDGQVDRALDGSDALCILTHATGTCADGACSLNACDTGWQDVDGDAQTGCERGISVGAGQVPLDPVVPGTPVAVQVGGGGVMATAYLSGADPASARVTLIVGAAARQVGDATVAYTDVDMAIAEPGFVVVGSGQRIVQSVVTWTRRAADGGQVFSGSEPIGSPSVVAVAATDRRFMLAWVTDRGRLSYMAFDAAAGRAPLAGPFELASGMAPGVRPVVVALSDGFALFAANDAAGLLGWYFDLDGGLIVPISTDLRATVEDMSATQFRGTGRLALKLANTVFLQDFGVTTQVARFGPLSDVGRALPALNPGLIGTQRGWILTWINTDTGRAMSGLLDDADQLIGNPALLFPQLRPRVDVMRVHSAANAGQGRIGVTTGGQGITGVLDFN